MFDVLYRKIRQKIKYGENAVILKMEPTLNVYIDMVKLLKPGQKRLDNSIKPNVS